MQVFTVFSNTVCFFFLLNRQKWNQAYHRLCPGSSMLTRLAQQSETRWVSSWSSMIPFQHTPSKMLGWNQFLSHKQKIDLNFVFGPITSWLNSFFVYLKINYSIILFYLCCTDSNEIPIALFQSVVYFVIIRCYILNFHRAVMNKTIHSVFLILYMCNCLNHHYMFWLKVNLILFLIHDNFVFALFCAITTSLYIYCKFCFLFYWEDGKVHGEISPESITRKYQW